MAPQEKFSFWPYNKSLTKLVRSRWLDIGFSFFAFLCIHRGSQRPVLQESLGAFRGAISSLHNAFPGGLKCHPCLRPGGEAKRRMTFQTNFQGNCRLLLCRFQLCTGGLEILPHAREKKPICALRYLNLIILVCTLCSSCGCGLLRKIFLSHIVLLQNTNYTFRKMMKI